MLLHLLETDSFSVECGVFDRKFKKEITVFALLVNEKINKMHKIMSHIHAIYILNQLVWK